MKFEIIAIILILFTCSSAESEMGEIFLVPKDFRGKVNIIYNIKDGSDEKYENNMRVYLIPENGILLTKFKDLYGNTNQFYYLIDSSGNRSKINVSLDEKSGTNDSAIFIFRAGTVGVYGNSDDSNSLKYQEFYVSDKTNLNKYFGISYINKFEQMVMELTKSKF